MHFFVVWETDAEAAMAGAEVVIGAGVGTVDETGV